MVGLSLTHTRAHLYRAFLEAVASPCAIPFECAGTDVGDRILVAGGVAKSPLWRQIIADVTGRAVVCPEMDVEATLSSNLILAGTGLGLFTFEEAKSWQTFAEPVRPDPETVRDSHEEYYQIYRALYPALRTQMAALSELPERL